MIHPHDALRAHLLETAGIVDRRPVPSLETIRLSEWSSDFEQLQRNRMVMGAFRYGPVARQDFTQHELTTEIKRRVRRYECTRNLEHLVDAANICMVAYLQGLRHGECLTPTDNGPHTQKIS